jgi:predicted AlkP superfamily pyrophosphatase or phosphodiesterase
MANGLWYAESSDLRATPIWEWARTAGLSTAAVSWPSTVGARIDALVAEQDYYDRADPLPLLFRSSTTGLFERLGVKPRREIFRDIVQWDAFLAETAAAIIRQDRPRLLLLHLVEPDYAQHRNPLAGDVVRAAVRRVDGHVGTIVLALKDAGIAGRSTIIVTGDHGFAPIHGVVSFNSALTRAGLRACPWDAESWRATAHVTGAAAAVFVNPPGDPEAAAAAAAALEAAAPGLYRLVTREELDRMGAMPNAAVFALEAAPGYGLSGACDRKLVDPARGGTHGYLPTRPEMATGFIAAGAGIRAGAVLDRMRLIDIAPTAARLLGLTPPPLDGRALEGILK